MSIIESAGFCPDAVRSRLRSSVTAWREKSLASGARHGVTWAANCADQNELVGLVELAQVTADFQHYCDEVEAEVATANEIAWRLTEAIRGSCDNYDFAEFWQSYVFGEEADKALENPWMLIGFARGAVEVFNEINPS